MSVCFSAHMRCVKVVSLKRALLYCCTVGGTGGTGGTRAQKLRIYREFCCTPHRTPGGHTPCAPDSRSLCHRSQQHRRNVVARHRRAPETSNGVIIGRRAMAVTFGCSVRTIDRWVATEGFPAATLPSGNLCTSSTLIDLWLLGRLRSKRPDTFGAGRDEPRT